VAQPTPRCGASARCAGYGRYVTTTPRVAVIGAGFGGLGAAVAVRETADVVVFERGDDVGGVWRENTYPGAACDVPSHLYSFSFVPEHRWSRRFAPQPDILRYLRRVTDECGLRPRLRLRTEVTEARYDDERRVWRLVTATGDVVEVDVLVPACGQLTHPAQPDLPGLASFRGVVVHSARWDHSLDLRGRRVAVVGTGASAIQIVPAIADDVATLTVFQRSAAHLAPKPDRRYSALHRALFRHVPAWPRLARSALMAVFERAGAVPVQPAPGPVQLFFRALLHARVRDGVLRARLRPPHPVGCRRVLVSSDYHRALHRPHVDLVTASITGLTSDGVRTADGAEHPVDVVVLATGFDADEFLAPMKVFGRGGRELSDEWRDGARAHLGVSVPGFPNLFLVHGPNTALRAGSVVHMIECQALYIRQAVSRIAAGARTLEVRRDVANAFDAEIQRRLGAGTRRSVNDWPGTMREYERRTAKFDDAEYRTT
jgi:cation diffusion facilitator CzcD-associated flavoprotein CzcO